MMPHYTRTKILAPILSDLGKFRTVLAYIPFSDYKDPTKPVSTSPVSIRFLQKGLLLNLLKRDPVVPFMLGLLIVRLNPLIPWFGLRWCYFLWHIFHIIVSANRPLITRLGTKSEISSSSSYVPSLCAKDGHTSFCDEYVNDNA